MTSRYGVRIRKLVDSAKKQQSTLYECPKCGKAKVKRESFAKWHCRSCGVSFVGGAYSPETNVGITAKKVIMGIQATSNNTEN